MEQNPDAAHGNVTAAPSPDYVRRLFAQILDWYKAADLKAQLIIGANGTFLTILSGSAFAQGPKFKTTVDAFGAETWVFLVMTAVAMLGSSAAAVCALHSRTMRGSKVKRTFAEHGVDVGDHRTYDPAVMWFFQFVARLDEEPFEKALTLLGTQPELEIEALADQCILLSQNVVRKHRLINLGFMLLGLALSSLTLATASYVMRLAQ